MTQPNAHGSDPGQEAVMQNILVIDDDKLMCLALAKILISAGYNVVQAGDGEEGLKLYRSQDFDLVITDLIMPDKEGIQIIRELRKENSRIRIIAMSAGGRGGATDYLKWARLMGAKQCLSKPIKREDLLDAVQAVLALP
ncbi:MAG: response regulator [Desulfomicrobium apsheronum]|uniref:response regulator n=1 Tax=Desulfomicrobium apsheronum TaxID=52560 RepID=UPI0015A6BEE2|nr:response regulator [Desulfomicrobium apsheronum]MDY0226711.1 response regulator [Desulfomicrobium apsheronum]